MENNNLKFESVWNLSKNVLPTEEKIYYCFCQTWKSNHYEDEYKIMYFDSSFEFRDGSILPCFIEVNVDEMDPSNWAHPDIYDRKHGVIHVVAWMELPQFPK